MAQFTEEQIKELETIFGLQRISPQNLLNLKDGIARKGDKVWFRGENKPELVNLTFSHWDNAKKYPQHYQLNEPKFKVTYED